MMNIFGKLAEEIEEQIDIHRRGQFVSYQTLINIFRALSVKNGKAEPEKKEEALPEDNMELGFHQRVEHFKRRIIAEALIKNNLKNGGAANDLKVGAHTLGRLVSYLEVRKYISEKNGKAK